MGTRRRESPLFLAWTIAVTLAAAAFFYLPARAACGGDWPVPLDDVFIHYDFARSWAEGHPFTWISGQGYSSGETSPAYALLLAGGYLVGFRALSLGVFTALVACAALVVMMHAIGRLARPGPRWVPVLAAPMLVSCGTLDFTWFSGMEVALFGAVAASLLVAVDRARRAGPVARARRQWWVGLLGAALVLVRPEAAVVVAVATFVVARRAGACSALAACSRVAFPGAVATVAVAALNRAHTGDAASAGALLKLLSSNPFSTDEQRARDYIVNLASFVRAMTHDGAYVFPLLALASLTSRRTRALGAVCLGGATAYFLLVSWNGAARFQNYRDYMPPFALVLFAACLGLAACARGRARPLVGGAVALLAVLLSGSRVAAGARFYRRAATNIHDQQVAVGRRLAARRDPGAIVLVGDAGAIPYLSRWHAVDALGLGGYHGVPFVRAAVEGEAATLEMIERLPVAERPTVLALYPNWFPGITGAFGHERDRVTIADNVICGGPTKVIYDADWSGMLSPADDPMEETALGVVVDEVDVGDVVSEAAHGYRSPAPHGGWTLFDVRTTARGTRRFDAGRVTPAGAEESFTLAAPAAALGMLLVRTDETDGTVTVSATRADAALFVTPLVHAPVAGKRAWSLAHATFPTALRAGDRLTLRVTAGALHDFHAWLVQGKP